MGRMERMKQMILDDAGEMKTAHGRVYKVLSLKQRDVVALESGITRKEVETAALDLEVIPERYSRNLGFIGIEGQKRLLRSCVLLVGLGGLGGTVAELLARVGVGRLVVVDGDDFNESNLNRQALCSEETIGRSKVEVAVERLKCINSAMEVTAIKQFINDRHANSLPDGADVVVDALDSLPGRYLLEKKARDLKVPLVHGAVAGFTGQVGVIFPKDRGFAAVYGLPQGEDSKGGLAVEFGNSAAVVSTVAALQVQEIVKIIVNVGEVLRNKLLCIDFLEVEFRKMDI